MMMSSIAILLLGLSSLTNAQKTADKQADVTYRHRRIKSLPWVNKGRYYHYYRAEAGPTDYDDETSVQPSEQSFQPPPHKPPSSSSSPTCLNNFNICYSLDMSGSVCSNNNNPLVCDQCGYTGSGSMCGDAEFGFIDFNTCGSSCNCCNNWKSVSLQLQLSFCSMIFRIDNNHSHLSVSVSTSQSHSTIVAMSRLQTLLGIS